MSGAGTSAGCCSLPPPQGAVRRPPPADDTHKCTRHHNPPDFPPHPPPPSPHHQHSSLSGRKKGANSALDSAAVGRRLRRRLLAPPLLLQTTDRMPPVSPLPLGQARPPVVASGRTPAGRPPRRCTRRHSLPVPPQCRSRSFGAMRGLPPHHDNSGAKRRVEERRDLLEGLAKQPFSQEESKAVEQAIWCHRGRAPVPCRTAQLGRRTCGKRYTMTAEARGSTPGACSKRSPQRQSMSSATPGGVIRLCQRAAWRSPSHGASAESSLAGTRQPQRRRRLPAL